MPEHHTIENKPLVATIFADRVLERSFLGFGMEWEYEGDRPDNNVGNPVWTDHWPEIVRRVDFMRPSKADQPGLGLGRAERGNVPVYRL